MKKICYYVSDYGFGHASRSIAVIRRILSQMDDVHVTVKCSSPFAFLKDSLEGTGVECICRKNDVGVILKEGSPEVDCEKTKLLFEQWMDTWPEYISQEAEYLQKEHIDLVISDIVPQAFTAADSAGIPSIAVSNFTWHLIFTSLFGICPKTDSLVQAYETASCAMRLPFHEPMAVFSDICDIPLISRESTVPRHDMRESLGINDERVVFLNIPDTEKYITKEFLTTAAGENVRIILPTHCRAEIPGSIKIPDDVTESQNWIGMCDCVVSKVGYSTVSEAVRGNVPILLLRRNGFAEDNWIIEAVERDEFGREMGISDLKRGEWLKDVSDLTVGQDNTLNCKYCDYKYDGTDIIIDTIGLIIV